MMRCSSPTRRRSTGMLAALALLAAAAPAVAFATEVAPQYLPRRFPHDTLRGKMVFGLAPELKLNGEAARLAPGARVHGLDNMLILSGALTGIEAQVNYTLDTYSLVKEVWVLRDDEIARRWPSTREEAAEWTFDELGQTWTRP